MSAGPSNTDPRGVSSNVVPPHSTVPPPARGRIITSVWPVASAIEPDSAPVLNYLGYMNADRNVRVEEALALVQKAVEIEPQSAAYYRVSPGQRVAAGVAYIAVAALLTLGMSATFVERDL